MVGARWERRGGRWELTHAGASPWCASFDPLHINSDYGRLAAREGFGDQAVRGGGVERSGSTGTSSTNVRPA